MFNVLPIEINYKILNSCTNVTIATFGLINKECYTHILDPIKSSTCFYNSAKKLSLFRLMLTIKLDHIFNKKITYMQNRDILIEMDEHVQVGNFHGINKYNLDDFRHWLLKITLEEIVDCIFISDKIIIYDDSESETVCYKYCIRDQNNIVNNLEFYSPDIHNNQDSFYLECNLFMYTYRHSINFDYQYLDLQDSFEFWPKFVEYIVDTSSAETHCFWYLTYTTKYYIVAVSTKVSDNQTNIDLVLVDKNILVKPTKDDKQFDFNLLFKYSFQISSPSHPCHIKVCHDNAESRLYIIVLGITKFELFVFGLDSKNFTSSNIKVDCKYYDCKDYYRRKTYPISLSVVDDRYLLITILNGATLFLYWVNIRPSLIYLESVETYRGGMVNSIRIDVKGILIQEYDGDYGFIYCFY